MAKTESVNWKEILKVCRDKRVRTEVPECLLSNGISVSDGKPNVNGIPMPVASIASHLNLSRRQVSHALEVIKENAELSFLFENVRARASMAEVAHRSGLGVLQVQSTHPESAGIVYRIAEILMRRKISLRSIVADDSEINPTPVLTLSLYKGVPDGLIDEIRKIDAVSVTVYPSNQTDSEQKSPARSSNVH